MHVKSLPQNFNIKAMGQPALVVVGAEWCGHCARAKPVIRDVAKSIGTMVPVYWADGDAHPDKVKAWGVDGFPTVFFKTPEGAVYRYEGAVTLDGVVNFVCTLRSDLCTRVRVS